MSVPDEGRTKIRFERNRVAAGGPAEVCFLNPNPTLFLQAGDYSSCPYPVIRTTQEDQTLVRPDSPSHRRRRAFGFTLRLQHRQ